MAKDAELGSQRWPFCPAIQTLSRKILSDRKNETDEATWETFLHGLQRLKDSLSVIVHDDHLPIRMRIGYACDLYQNGKVADAREEFEKGYQESLAIALDLEDNVTTLKMAALCCVYSHEHDVHVALRHIENILRRFNEDTEVINLFRPRTIHTHVKKRSRFFPWKKTKPTNTVFLNPRESIKRDICSVNLTLVIFFLQTGVIKDLTSWPQVPGAPRGHPVEGILGISPVYLNRKGFFGNGSDEQHFNMEIALHDRYVVCSGREIGAQINIFNLQNLNHIAQIKTPLQDYEVIPTSDRLYIVERCNISAKEPGRIDVWDLQNLTRSLPSTVALPLKGIPYWLPVQVTKIGRLPVHLGAKEVGGKLKVLHSDGEITTWVTTEDSMKIVGRTQMQSPVVSRQPLRLREVALDNDRIFLSRNGLKIFSVQTGELVSSIESDDLAYPFVSPNFIARFLKRQASSPDQTAVRNYLYCIEVRRLPDLSLMFLEQFSPELLTVDKTFHCAIEDPLLALVTDRALSIWELTSGVRICHRDARALTPTGASASCLVWDTIAYLLVGFKNGTVQKLRIVD